MSKLQPTPDNPIMCITRLHYGIPGSSRYILAKQLEKDLAKYNGRTLALHHSTYHPDADTTPYFAWDMGEHYNYDMYPYFQKEQIG